MMSRVSLESTRAQDNADGGAGEAGWNWGQYVVVRTYSAGVHVGTLGQQDGKQVTLTDARRIWSWNGANTLHEIALGGVGKGSRISEPVGEIELTEAIEIIAATEDARASLAGAGWAK